MRATGEENRERRRGVVCVCGLRPKRAVVWKRLGAARVTNVGHGGNGDDVADADAVLSVALTVATR